MTTKGSKYRFRDEASSSWRESNGWVKYDLRARPNEQVLLWQGGLLIASTSSLVRAETTLKTTSQLLKFIRENSDAAEWFDLASFTNAMLTFLAAEILDFHERG